MMKIISIILLMMTVLGIHAQTVQDSIFTVNGVSFKMVYVEGGSFEMGTNNSEEDEAPAHDVALSSYMIGETEVTQELWQMVMGNNPSRFKGEVHRPVEQVSWEDCQKFVAKLNDLTGKRFRLPTEAEWEFAARGGIKSKGYMYSGSNTLNDVAWYNNNAHKVGEYSSDYGIHPVGTKLANELGLYDMSGNVLEWCQDWYDYNYYSRSPRFNPCGPVSGSLRIARGGCWFSQDEDNSVSKRTGFLPAFRYYHFGIRLVMALNDSVTDKTDFQIEKPFELNRTFNIDSVSFKMIYVEGGSFMMGDTIPNYDKYPHLVSLDSYMIGETEVTQELWEVVMGHNPSWFQGDSRRPVDTVSWEDCQGFINKLNDLTGEHFRLPTEAEWEFAARGGVNSRGYKYSGSNTLRNVAWYNDNAGWIVGKNTPNYGTHPVGMKSPNELGIYDMSGNVAEWCQDWYNSLYYLCLPVNIPINNPMGPYRGSERVLRGGSWIDLEDNMRNNKLVVYERNSNVPDLQLLIYGDGEERQCLGLRLVLDIGRSERSTILPEDNPDFIREGVTSIKYGAYSGQEELTSITIPKSVNCIEGCAFSGCTGLKTVIIPSGVTSIGGCAFSGCTNLASINIPEGVTSLEESVFTDCKSLSSIVVPRSVYCIGNQAFMDCSNLSSIRILDGVTWIGDLAFSGCTGLSNITIPNGVTWIGDFAFYGCTGLTSITIPNSVTRIGWCTFEGCSSLSSVVIPNSVTSIGRCTFKGCSSLTSVVIPNSVSNIELDAFYGCSGLTSIIIPGSITRIGYRSFEECTNLKKIIISDGVTSIGNSAFKGCTSLNSIIIPPSVTSIGNSAFYDCTGLTSITIPNSVTSIGKSAFSECIGLKSIQVDKDNQYYNDGNGGNCLIETNTRTLIKGCQTTIIPEGVTSIGIYAFLDCNGLNSIIIPNSVTNIGESAFYGCTGLTSITIPNSVTSIGESSFYGCTGLSHITIPNSVTSLGEEAFSQCSSLTSISIPNSVTSIGESAFSECIGLTSITIPNSVDIIGYHTFYNCTSLSSVTIPNSVINIEKWAFYGCSSLTSVLIPSSVKKIDHTAFDGCKCDLICLGTQPAQINGKIHSDITIYVPSDIVEQYKRAWGNDNIFPIETSKYKDVLK